MGNYSFYGYLAASIAYFLLLLISLSSIKKNPLAVQFSVAVGFSALWAGYAAFAQQSIDLSISETLPFETLRNAGWFFLLGTLLSRQTFNSNYILMLKSKVAYAVIIWSLFVLILELFADFRYEIQRLIGQDPRLLAHASFAIIGLILVEQVYRNAGVDERWVIKFLCLSLGGLFITDFIVYSKSLLFVNLDEVLWRSRGFINVLIIPLLGISNHRFQVNAAIINVSRKVVFHTAVLFGIGLYLILMSLAGFYIKNYGGNWGELAQLIFIFLAVLLLSVAFVSGKVKALAKFYFNKHFFHLRYDYRDEWIKLCRDIAMLDSLDELSGFIIKTMAELVDSSGGGLWLKNEQGDFYLTEENYLGFESPQLINADSSLLRFLISRRWVIDFVEFINDPEVYDEVDLSPWYAKEKNVWLIIPLFRQSDLEGFVVLTKARVVRRLNWEDHDLLKTAGMQLANALALSRASDALVKSRQFETYNRFSAYLVHDLKNLVAQVSLIVKNAEAHKHNMEFIDDSIATLENVVVKIDHLLAQLKKGNVKNEDNAIINLVDIIADVATQQAGNKPVLQLSKSHDKINISAEKEKVSAILGHLVQNAQDATDDNGSVRLQLTKENNQAIIKIIDTGSGMDTKFIAERLFKPFDTTKGNAGMGIGVYEAREYILKNSGQIAVESQPGKGTTFIIKLPLADLIIKSEN